MSNQVGKTRAHVRERFMSRASIRFAPDVLRRLGEELNPNPHRGILELAKNAYDADARPAARR